MKKYFSKVVILWICLISGLLTSENFTIEMTSDQYSSFFSAYIAEFNGKKCYVRPGHDVNACIKYCQYYYDYVPSLPYKNAQTYNPTTRLCEPKIFCPRIYGIVYETGTGKCKDILEGTYVPGVDAPVPTYKNTSKVNVICQHGIVKPFNGKPDCQCIMGYGSLPSPAIGTIKSFMKCNQLLSVAVYFPNFLKIYYDETYDNLFPYASSSDYWSQLVQYYIRSIKYSIITFFIPYEVQIILLVVPQEPTLKPIDWIWFTWLILFFFILFAITMYERCVNGMKKNRVET